MYAPTDFPEERTEWERDHVVNLKVLVSANCCGVGVEDPNSQEAGSNGGGGGNGGGVAVIPDRASLELDKLPPYHDVAPSPGESILIISIPKQIDRLLL